MSAFEWNKYMRKKKFNDAIRTHLTVFIISLPMVSQDEINHCMEQIIDELCNVDSKRDQLTE